MEPTPIRCRERCYSCKVPWKANHRCRGKGKVHIVEVHYDSEDEEMHVNETIDAYLEQSDKASDVVTRNRIWVACKSIPRQPRTTLDWKLPLPTREGSLE
jgi:hypothetical protein